MTFPPQITEAEAAAIRALIASHPWLFKDIEAVKRLLNGTKQ